MKPKIDAIILEMFREEFGSGWTAEDDRRFWSMLRGRRGLRAMAAEANRLEMACLRATSSLSDRKYMRYRLRCLHFCIILNSLEELARIFSRNLPHFFAKFAAELFTEMADRAELVLEQKGPELLNFSGEIHGQSAVCHQNNPSSRRAAG